MKSISDVEFKRDDNLNSDGASGAIEINLFDSGDIEARISSDAAFLVQAEALRYSAQHKTTVLAAISMNRQFGNDLVEIAPGIFDRPLLVRLSKDERNLIMRLRQAAGQGRLVVVDPDAMVWYLCGPQERSGK
jgi:hypothetical protein